MTILKTTLARDQNGWQDTPTVLSRYAKAIAKVVEAGGPKPLKPIYINPTQEVIVSTPFGNVFNKEMYAVPHLEKYVREDVVVWAESVTEWRVKRTPLGTEAHIGLLESIASVVAGEKVNTRLDSDESSSGEVG